jgi:RNA polymerase sigma factor (TIGR02999 family)
MINVTQILSRIESGDLTASEQLLPLVYQELRHLAAQRLAQEKPGQTLQATALVHEAYLRLVDHSPAQHWNSRGHFYAAAAEAMRRILIESARRRSRQKRGGGLERIELAPSEIAAPSTDEELLSLNDALERLEAQDDKAAELIKLRFFAGLTIPEAAAVLDVSPRKADFMWSFARAWLRRELQSK